MYNVICVMEHALHILHYTLFIILPPKGWCVKQ